MSCDSLSRNRRRRLVLVVGPVTPSPAIGLEHRPIERGKADAYASAGSHCVGGTYRRDYASFVWWVFGCGVELCIGGVEFVGGQDPELHPRPDQSPPDWRSTAPCCQTQAGPAAGAPRTTAAEQPDLSDPARAGDRDLSWR